MTEEDRIKSCSTKLFQKFNDINVPVVIMVTKNKKRLEKKYLDYDFDDYIIKPINKRSINFIMEIYLKDKKINFKINQQILVADLFKFIVNYLYYFSLPHIFERVTLYSLHNLYRFSIGIQTIAFSYFNTQL